MHELVAQSLEAEGAERAQGGGEERRQRPAAEPGRGAGGGEVQREEGEGGRGGRGGRAEAGRAIEARDFLLVWGGGGNAFSERRGGSSVGAEWISEAR